MYIHTTVAHIHATCIHSCVNICLWGICDRISTINVRIFYMPIYLCSHRFTFNRRDYFIEAPSKKDLHKWVRKIEIALGVRQEGIGLPDFELMSVVGKGAAGMVYAVGELFFCVCVCVCMRVCFSLCVCMCVCVCVTRKYFPGTGVCHRELFRMLMCILTHVYTFTAYTS
jgi:hypothetical protein